MMKKLILILWLIILATLLSTAACKKSSEVIIPSSKIIGPWEFHVDFSPTLNLNLPRIWMFSFNQINEVYFFSEKKGPYDFDGGGIQFECPYNDRFRMIEHHFFISGHFSNEQLTGAIYKSSYEPEILGTFWAQRTGGLIMFDIVGTWDFQVTYTEPYYLEVLPGLWQFTFNDSDELWLYDERKNSYDFDGRNVRFPCHYYIDISQGSAVNLLFLGYMSSQDSIAGYLYNDVGGSWIIGTVNAVRLN
ncbi:MAG: hypothetical protein QG657_5743 [Acidobacteriota bacterium]|nr:hypothetical protein [Acidobacteriota bacterium]